eukprot:CAMPEP_0177593494 /NCGR_PEP_ID=MMETSP0419_2-20121207/9184_1 /TAXON_ID=582737 /ORGANISM="Tetraselmis sp., Strain GSL018" /LENGTH=215 /DNA_ID=CAMNT_0019084553 /DNA_START=365 /DNA_END=1015 /DNA_ORIENTATION=+
MASGPQVGAGRVGKGLICSNLPLPGEGVSLSDGLKAWEGIFQVLGNGVQDLRRQLRGQLGENIRLHLLACRDELRKRALQLLCNGLLFLETGLGSFMTKFILSSNSAWSSGIRLTTSVALVSAPNPARGPIARNVKGFSIHFWSLEPIGSLDPELNRSLGGGIAAWEPNSGVGDPPGVWLDEEVLNYILNGLQRASAQNALHLKFVKTLDEFLQL